MNENEFSYGGKTYVAVEEGISCKCCAFWEGKCGALQWHGKIPPCSAPDRKDERDVCFVMKETEEREEAARYSLQCKKESLDELIARTEREKKAKNQDPEDGNTSGGFSGENSRGSEYLSGIGMGARRRDTLKGESGGANAESTATHLEPWSAEKALSRALNERDELRALRDAMEKALYEAHEFLGKRKRELEQLSAANAELAAQNVELRTKIEHLRNDVAYWRGESKAQEQLVDVLAKENELLTAKGKAKR